jgi:transcription initiation factor TFIIIB Brf1 subunit/transcription initiation factor TFIIB
MDEEYGICPICGGYGLLYETQGLEIVCKSCKAAIGDQFEPYNQEAIKI